MDLVYHVTERPRPVPPKKEEKEEVVAAVKTEEGAAAAGKVDEDGTKSPVVGGGPEEGTCKSSCGCVWLSLEEPPWTAIHLSKRLSYNLSTPRYILVCPCLYLSIYLSVYLSCLRHQKEVSLLGRQVPWALV